MVRLGRWGMDNVTVSDAVGRENARNPAQLFWRTLGL
jgi:hypothetical protein